MVSVRQKLPANPEAYFRLEQEKIVQLHRYDTFGNEQIIPP